MKQILIFLLVVVVLSLTTVSHADQICKTWVYDLEDTYIILSKIDCGDGQPGFGGMLLGYDGVVHGAWGSLEGDLETVNLDEKQVVYVVKGGSAYHMKKDCHGMSNAWEVPLCIAVKMGFQPCKDCVK